MATIKIKKTGGEDEIVDRVSQSRGPIENSVEIRDLISGLVGGGYTDLSNDDAKKNLARLQVLVGRPKANEILQKVVIHNQDPRYKAQGMEDRISTFYDQQKEDPIIGKARSLGYGVLPGFRTSPNVLLQGLQSSVPSSSLGEIPGYSKNLMLKINK